MKKIIIFMSIFILPAQLHAGEELTFRWKRDFLYPNSYYLNINNHGTRTLRFNGYGEGDFFIKFRNGSKINLDPRAFNDHYFKGMMWIPPGDSGYIPFKIDRRQFRQADKIFINGSTAIEKRQGSFVDYEDERELNIVIDLRQNKVEYTEGELNPKAKFNSSFSADDNPRIEVDGMNDGMDDIFSKPVQRINLTLPE